MSPSFREQISSNIRNMEDRLNFLRMQNQPDQSVIEGEKRELEILKRKLSLLPRGMEEGVLSH